MTDGPVLPEGPPPRTVCFAPGCPRWAVATVLGAGGKPVHLCATHARAARREGPSP